MNDIEIIDYLKEIIQEIEYRHKDGELILVNDITTDKLYYSIKGLLDLYNKEKERNKDLEEIEKEHKEENGRLREENEVLRYGLRENKILRHGLEENTEEIDKLYKIINLMAEELADWYMDNRIDNRKIDKQYVINKFTNKIEEE